MKIVLCFGIGTWASPVGILCRGQPTGLYGRGTVGIPKTPNQHCLPQVWKTLPQTVLVPFLPLGQKTLQKPTIAAVPSSSDCVHKGDRMGAAFVTTQPVSSPTSIAQRLHFLGSNCSSVKR